MAADTQHHLDCYAKEGLRTLCFTKKVADPQAITFPLIFTYTRVIFCLHACVCVLQVVTEAALERWSETRREALAAMENREELVMESAAELETDLTLLGNHIHNTEHAYKRTSTSPQSMRQAFALPRVVAQAQRASRTVSR